VDYWLAHDLRPMVDDLLAESQLRRRGLFRPEVVRRYVDDHRRGAEDWSMQIWQLLTLEIWMQLFLDGGAHSLAQQKIGASQVELVSKIGFGKGTASAVPLGIKKQAGFSP